MLIAVRIPGRKARAACYPCSKRKAWVCVVRILWLLATAVMHGARGDGHEHGEDLVMSVERVGRRDTVESGGQRDCTYVAQFIAGVPQDLDARAMVFAAALYVPSLKCRGYIRRSAKRDCGNTLSAVIKQFSDQECNALSQRRGLNLCYNALSCKAQEDLCENDGWPVICGLLATLIFTTNPVAAALATALCWLQKQKICKGLAEKCSETRTTEPECFRTSMPIAPVYPTKAPTAELCCYPSRCLCIAPTCETNDCSNLEAVGVKDCGSWQKSPNYQSCQPVDSLYGQGACAVNGFGCFAECAYVATRPC
jgi:hypothetical protein